MDEDAAYCSKCKGVKKVLLGVLILLNAFWWPQWTGLDGWIKFFGVLFILFGLLRVFKPKCGCGPEVCSTKKKR